MFNVATWVARLNRDGPGGTPSHEALSVSSEGALEISSVVGQSPFLVRSHFSSPTVAAKPCKCERHGPSPQRRQYPNVYRCLKRRLGHSHRASLYKRSLIRQGKKATHKCSISRMVTASAGVQTDLSKVVHSSCRSIYHTSELVGSHCLCLPSHGSPSQGDPKNQAKQLPHHSNSPRPARDALVL